MADSVPTITVLAGTNGAGKSSIGGARLEAARTPFYNPDVETQRLIAANPGMTLDEANAAAWRIGKERLEAAIAERHSFNFETTLGGTTIARLLAHELAAVYLRIDSIEQSLRATGCAVEGLGYSVAYAVAEDTLRLGRIVVADCVNPWPLTRSEWRAVADRTGVPALDVEIVCSDAREHRRRVETRATDIMGHRLPTWQEVVERDYRPWDVERIVIDTARLSVEQSVRTILAEIPAGL